VTAFDRSAVTRWFRTRWQGPFLLQLCVYGIVGIVLAVFLASYPAGLPEWRFFGTVAALAALLALNLFLINPIASASPKARSLKEWSFLSLSAMLVLAKVRLSGESSMVYLLSIVCGQSILVDPSGSVRLRLCRERRLSAAGGRRRPLCASAALDAGRALSYT